MGNILDWIVEKATKYEPLVKTGVAALSTYASFKDQQKKNQMQQAAYDDYMAQAEAAGHAARAAIDVNYTPMTVSGVPTTKADVTDFTAVAARGGLMNLPTKQRKRYARGPEEFEVQEMEEEVFSPGDFKMETGVDVLGEQVFYDTGKGDRSNAAQIWNQMQNPDKAIFDFDFEIFFMDGGWRDMIKSQVDVQEDVQLASAPSIEDSQNEMSMNLFNKPYHQLNQQELDILNEMGAAAPRAEGIMQAAKGGRIGYRRGRVVHPGGYSGDFGSYKDFIESTGDDELMDLYVEGLSSGDFTRLFDALKKKGYPAEHARGGRIGYRLGTPETVVADQETILKTPNEEVVTNQMEEIKGQTAGPQWYQDRYDHLIFLGYSEIEAADIAYDSDKYYEAVGHDPYAKGGRVKKDNGGIMNLGGLEKDYRTTGGFVPIGEYEKKDDVPARLSKNEFVMTADAVRAAGGGSINKGAQRMYDTMKHLEAQPQAKRMTA